MVLQIAKFYMCISLTNLEEKTGSHAITIIYIASIMNLYRYQGAAMTATYIASMMDLYRVLAMGSVSELTELNC